MNYNCIKCKKGHAMMKEMYNFLISEKIETNSSIFMDYMEDEKKKEFLKFFFDPQNLKIRFVSKETLDFLNLISKKDEKEKLRLLNDWQENPKKALKNISSEIQYKKEELDIIQEEMKIYFEHEFLKVSSVFNGNRFRAYKAICKKVLSMDTDKDFELEDMCLCETIEIMRTLKKVFIDNIKKTNLSDEKFGKNLLSCSIDNFKRILKAMNNFNATLKDSNYKKVNLSSIGSEKGNAKEILTSVNYVIRYYFNLDSYKNNTGYFVQHHCFLDEVEKRVRYKQPFLFVNDMYSLDERHFAVMKEYLREIPKNKKGIVDMILYCKGLNFDEFAKKIRMKSSPAKSMLESNNSKKFLEKKEDICRILMIDEAVLENGFGKVYESTEKYEKGESSEKDFIQLATKKFIKASRMIGDEEEIEVNKCISMIRYLLLKFIEDSLMIGDEEEIAVNKCISVIRYLSLDDKKCVETLLSVMKKTEKLEN